ncbi:ArnT family glycosyltransferase [Microbacterium sp. NPDC091313]
MRTTSALPRWRHQRLRYRIGLGLVLAAFLVLTGWNLARGGDAAFYASSARSMSESWRALLFGAFDPAATVTLDKLSGFAVPQAAAIAVFGMSTSSLALPQVLEGLVTVWAVSVIGLRWGGARVGMLAAAAAASTPVFVSMFAHPMEDGLLTMALAVAVLWWQRALITGRLWPLLLAGLFVGVGFQAKMMQAWFVLPALLLGTLVAAPTVRRRLRDAGVLLATAVAASLAWITVIALVPAGSRPYIDGSVDDSVFAMVFGYNGVDRLIPGAVDGAVGSAGHHASTQVLAALFSSTPQPADASPLKLLLSTYATQIGWLYPAAAAGVVLALVRWWPRRGRRDRPRFALAVAVVVWLVTAAAVLSVAHLPHTAYIAAIGVQLVLLAAVGWGDLLRRARRSRRADRFLLAGLVLVQGAWALWLATHGREPLQLAAPAAVLCALAVAAALALALRPRRAPRRERAVPRARTSRLRRRLPTLLAAATAVGVIAGQALFSVQALDAARDGSGGDASVGVRLSGSASPSEVFRPSAPDVWGGTSSISPTDRAVMERAADVVGDDPSRPLFLTDAWTLSADVITTTGRSVLTDGGYSGSVPVFTADDIHRLITTGEVQLLAVRHGESGRDPVEQVAASSSCSLLQTFGDTSGPEAGGRLDAFDLFQCR